MSLVNEALKKARLEAARQDAARRGLPLPGAQLATPPHSGPNLVRIGLIALVVLAAALLFFFGRYSSKRSTVATAELSEVSASTDRPESTVPVQTESTTVEAPPPALQAAEPTDPSSAPSATAPVARQEPTASRESAPEPPPLRETRSSQVRVRTPLSDPADTPEPTQGTVGRPRQRPAPRQPASEAVAGSGGARVETPPASADSSLQSVVRTLDVPGGGRIELGGIAWSEDRPFALINGRVVGPGDSIESLTVVRIQQRAVELQGDAGHFLVRLK